MRGAWIAVTGILMAVCLGITAPAVEAGPKTRGPLPIHQFTADASNGYELTVYGVPGRRKRGARVVLQVSGGAAGVSYEAPGVVTARRLAADFGAVGAVDVRFRQSGPSRSMRPSCGGDPILYRPGEFVGSVEFHGEEGFAGASLDRVVLDPRPIFEQLCYSYEEAHGTGDGVILMVLGKFGFVEAVENQPGARALLSLAIGED